MADFDTLTLEQVNGYFATDRLTAAHTLNRLFASGDHFQRGAGWIGTIPPSGSEIYGPYMAALQKGFTSSNDIAEIVSRHVNGVVGRESTWSAALIRPLASGTSPTPDEAARMQEIDAATTAWWDRAMHTTPDPQRPGAALTQRGLITFWQAVVWGVLLEERRTLRLYIPRGLRNPHTGGLLRPVTTLEEALGVLCVEAVDATQGGVFIDPDTAHEVGVVRYTKNTQDYAELSYLNDQGATVLRVISGDTIISEGDPMLLGRRLWHRELYRPALISEQVRQNQMQANMARTQMGRNVNVAGHKPTFITNAQPPQDGYKTGPAMITELFGAPIRNDHGDIIGISNPNVTFGEPTDVAHFLSTIAEARAAMLNETQQAHMLLADQAIASGKSRIEARAEYKASLERTSSVIDSGLRWLLETAVAIAANLINQPTRYADLRIDAACRIDTGPLSADEREANRLDVQQGLMSRERAVSANGADDTSAELARIESDRLARGTTDMMGTAAAAAPALKIGDRVRILNPHDPQHKTGTVALFEGTAIGLIVDGMESMGVHKWYVASELERITDAAPEPADQAPAMAGMEM